MPVVCYALVFTPDIGYAKIQGTHPLHLSVRPFRLTYTQSCLIGSAKAETARANVPVDSRLGRHASRAAGGSQLPNSILASGSRSRPSAWCPLPRQAHAISSSPASPCFTRVLGSPRFLEQNSLLIGRPTCPGHAQGLPRPREVGMAAFCGQLARQFPSCRWSWLP